MLLMTAYAAFANAAGVAIAMLIQERQIKSRKPTELCYRLPSLDELDALNGRIIAWAYPLLLVGLAMGFVWSYDDWGRLWTNDTKIRLALVTAAVYGVFIWRRYVVGRRGRRNVYVSLLGFASVLLTFFGAELFGGRHSFMGGLR
jgi:ABC-type transport system involved in cytochrome c biogenesis permease subunit